MSDIWVSLYLLANHGRKHLNILKGESGGRIEGWQEKLLSKAGKEVLIKAVAQAIPTYAMSCFELTKGLCDELNSMIGRWWWSQNDKKKTTSIGLLGTS